MNEQELLKKITRLKYDSNLKPDKTWRRNTLYLLRQQMGLYDVYEQQRKSWMPRFFFQQLTLAPVRVFAALVLVLFAGGGGLTFASQTSLPGDFLYPVKSASELLRRFIAITPEQKINVSTKITQTRTDELEKLILQQASAELVNETAKNLAIEIENMVFYIQQNPTIEPVVFESSQETIKHSIQRLKTFIPSKTAKITPSSSQPLTPETALSPSIDPTAIQPSVEPQQELPPKAQQPSSTPSVSEPTQTIPAQPQPSQQQPSVKTPTQQTTAPTQTQTPSREPIQKFIQPSTSVTREVIQKAEVVAPEESQPILKEKIEQLNEAQDEITATHLKVAPSQKAEVKVEEKIQDVGKEIKRHEEQLPLITDPVHRQQVQEVLDTAKTQLNESEAKFQEQSYVESFQSARETDRLFKTVEELPIAPSPIKTLPPSPQTGTPPPAQSIEQTVTSSSQTEPKSQPPSQSQPPSSQPQTEQPASASLGTETTSQTPSTTSPPQTKTVQPPTKGQDVKGKTENVKKR